MTAKMMTAKMMRAGATLTGPFPLSRSRFWKMAHRRDYRE
jgi:hypothetical protein